MPVFWNMSNIEFYLYDNIQQLTEKSKSILKHEF